MVFRVTRIDPPASPPHDAQSPKAAGELPRVELEIVRGRARQTRRQVVGKVFLIGSAGDCDLVLGDSQFPEAYAYLYVQPDGVTVRRLGEGPSLLVAGQSVQALELCDGTVLECGPYAFRVSIRQGVPDDGGRRQKLTHWAQSIAAADHLPSADDVLGLTVARTEVLKLLADIAAVIAPPQGSLKLYREPQASAPPSLSERVRRRASA